MSTDLDDFIVAAAEVKAASEPQRRQFAPPVSDPATTGDRELLDRQANRIDWTEFWATDLEEDFWLVEPFIPRGKAVSLTAPAKVGKSLVTLHFAASLAIGSFGQPVNVLYCDYEMTATDLKDRLEAMGYGSSTDLSALAYALQPGWGPLDTPTGGAGLVAYALACEAELVVIDTLSRVLIGNEDHATTIQDFYRHTVMALKQRGVAMLRLDHTGHNKERTRGSSAKNDDIDLAWLLKKGDNGNYLMERTADRSGRAPDKVALTKNENPLSFAVEKVASWPAGTQECADLLSSLGVPADATVATAQAVLTAANHGRRKTIVTAAVKYRRAQTPNLLPSGMSEFI
jgi:AAA domain